MQKALKFIIVFITILSSINLSSQNLLVNGDFESGFGVGFFINGAGYSQIVQPFSGTTSPGNYAITTNPQPMNTSNFIAGGDNTSGTGKMMIIDGNTTGGQQNFWEAGNGGSGVCSLTIGATYTFSFWIKSVSTTVTNAATQANLGVNILNASAVTLVSGSLTAPLPAAGWQKVTYTFVAQGNCVNLKIYNNNTNPVGNDFAIDDLSLIGAPPPLSLVYSITNLTCISANDGTIFGYGVGGVSPYANYALSGAVPTINSPTGFFTGLAPGNYTLSVTDAVGTTVSTPGIIIPNPVGLTLTAANTTICAGGSTTLTAAGGGTYSWSVVPATEVVPTGSNPTVSPTVPATYTVNSTTTSPDNLIYNGDFFLGNVGFISDYNYYASNTSNLQKAYGVVSNPNAWEIGLSNCGDHTNGLGKMMVVDGSNVNGGNDKVWCQTIPVTPGQNYNLSFYLQTLSNPAILANIEVVINGVSAGTSLAPNTICSWSNVTYPWNSGANTRAEICFYDRNTTPNGNDFALDDIVFSRINTCVLPPKSITINVTNTITLQITDPPAVCLPGTVNITTASVTVGSTAGLTYTYYTDAAAINQITAVAASSIGIGGIYYIKGTLGTCSVVKPVTVTLTPTGSVAAPIATSPVYFCLGSVATSLVATALPGGTLNWYGTNATGGTASATATIPSTAVNGTITYYVSQTIGTCESPRKAIDVIVNDVIGAINLVCDSSQVTTSPVTSVYFDWNNIVPPGRPDQYNYTYSINGGPLVTGSTILSSLEVFGVAPGQSCTFNIVSAPGYPCVTFPISTTCSNCSSSTTPTFTLPTAICSGSVAPVLPTTSDNGVSGSWSPTTISTTANGNYTFTPNYTLFPCAIQVIKSITVTNPPTTVLAGPNVCVGSSTTFTSSTAGGTWSSANTAIATVNASTGLVTGVSSGTVSIDYTFPAAGGCPAVVFSRPLTVTNPPNAGTIVGNLIFCAGDSRIFISTISGGTWSSSNTAVATIDPTFGQITALTAGTSIIKYTVTGTGNCPSASTQSTVNVSAIPNAGVLSGTQAICVGFSTTFSSTVLGGTWTSVDPTIATISNAGVVIGVAPGTTTIQYVVSGTGGCPASAPVTRSVFVSATVNPGILSGNQSICVGGNSIFSSTVSGGTWTSSNVSVATVNGSSGVITGISAGNSDIKYELTGTGGCANTSVIRPIAVNTNIVPTFSAVAPICAGSPLAPLPLVSTNGITGSWDLPVDNTTTTVYTFTPTTGLCATTTQLTITVNQRVTPLFGLFAPLCQGDTPPILPTSSDNIPAITGTWNNAVSTAALGTTIYTFTPTIGQCVSALPTTLSITVVPVLTPNFAPIAPFCDGFPAPILSTTSPNGIEGTWNPPTISNFISSPYTFNPTPGQCALNQTLNVTIIPRTVPNFATVAPFCKGSTAPVLPLTSPNGILGTWSPTTVDNTVSGTFPYLFTPNAGECATVATSYVEVTEPITPGFPDLSLCNGSIAPPLPAISPNGISGAWSPSVIDNTATGSYLFTPASGECAIPQTLNVTVNQYTLVAINGIVTNYFEDNQVITVLATDAGNYLYQLDYGPLQESNIFYNVTSGTHVIKVVDANGCSSPLSEQVLVINYPKFFTPNDDTFNDTWNIFGLADQLNSKIFIFDRYGKLLKQLSPKGIGWDGTFNGQALPADDYWFLVEYEENGNSKEFKAHFSLKR